MTEERPDDAREPDGTAGPADGDDGLEARRASGSDAPFQGLRSAADIFGAPRGEEDWPSRRERREAERTARETGAPLPEPFVAEGEAEAAEPAAAPAAPEPAAPALDDGATQAISMPPELLAPSENPDAVVEHERSTLHDRIPAAADAPPDSTAPHPSSIVLPTAQTHRDERAAASKAIEDERRRVDPFGEGRADVDWLGRATGNHPESVSPAAPAAPQPLGVENVLPPTEEPPTFTDLLRITSTGPVPTQTGAHDRPFDWAIGDDEPGEVPATLTTDSFDTTALSAGSWSLADESDDEDEVVAGEVDTPASGLPQAPRTYPVPPAVPVPPVVPPAIPAAPVSDTAAPAAVPDADADADAAAAAAAAAAGAPSEATEAVDAPRRPAGDDVTDATEGLQTDAPTTAMPAAGTPWWSEPEATVPPTAAPPLVEPTGAQEYPAHLPPSVGQDLDAVLGLRGNDTGPQPEPLPAAAPDDLDQSEWNGRETSDTSAIKDLFGTEAVGQLGGTGYDPEDTGTRMMPAAAVPAAAAAPAAAPAPAAAGRPAGGPDRPSGERDNFINEGFARLRNEGKRGKQLLIYGSIALILVLIVLVFLLSKWILGNNIADQAVPTKSPAAASAPATPSAAPSASASQSSEAAAPAATLQFATTPALPGEHPWTDLAGGECLSPFTNAWSQTFTVVDCATPHIGQLTARLPVQGDTYPGTEALATQAADQCQSDAALNASAAAAVGDVQVQGSYAPDQATWDQGDRFISCFVTRSSGQPLTGSLAPGA
ncbi:septum formation family protein [Curtobacterium flaccumfaciens]|uniref:septum formation family protein n=1 Tax=Curtobacterium flaccumfaciens TaxID=2035 RepID=UPI001BDE487B|nr:septum formation family protein [Curtobacterium flaccumfaciens]MBT1607651.1 septum formation family protein [Curtobacterium flaccumfaciens pv. betae]MBT1655804.1 septum formation family protein [Curtobacterium flaccumfaciens pv. betae]MCS0473327.1 septum formation family protein [Curtobacterium flaccumfaciens pv. betae]MCS0479911.1 septum formation family protein [Curtobacterium flaccumfaciens pv. betae]MCS0487273.1 septum formation family protein [Curtobacterium flaccumfaciens pv. betae]